MDDVLPTHVCKNPNSSLRCLRNIFLLQVVVIVVGMVAGMAEGFPQNANANPEDVYDTPTPASSALPVLYHGTQGYTIPQRVSALYTRLATGDSLPWTSTSL